MGKTNLKKLFLGYQKQMKVNLELLREGIDHPGTKGDSVELNWVEWLKNYLPKRYCVNKAFVVDFEGNISEQLDVVIYDQQYSPFVFNEKGVYYIPAESVYAIFEVKQTLNKDHLIYASKKIRSVRALKRTSAEIYDARGKVCEPKQPFKIIGGILTTESEWNPPMGESFEALIKDLRDDEMIDLGCSISDGSFFVKEIEGQTYISRSTQDEILIFFFLNLIMELQKKGTVPAMDIRQYAHSLDSM